MDIETLIHFQYLAKYKNITKAAQYFYINQSTLSRQLASLEQELDTTLFIRNNKRLRLTEAGEVFSRDCDLFIKHMDVIVNRAKSTGKGESGNVRIVVPGNLGSLLPKALKAFRSAYSGTKIIVEQYEFEQIPSSVLYDIYDIGFTYGFAVGNTTDSNEIAQVRVDEDSFSIVASKTIADTADEEHLIELVRNYPLFLPSHIEAPVIRPIVNELKRMSGRRELETIYLNRSMSVFLQISLGLGYSIYPTNIMDSHMSSEQTTFFPIESVSTKTKIVMLYKRANLSKATASFVETVKRLHTMR